MSMSMLPCHVPVLCFDFLAQIFQRPLFSFCQADDSGDGIPSAALQPLAKYDPPEIGDSSKRRLSTPWSRDMWGMGCIVWEVFNGPLPAPRNLGKHQFKLHQHGRPDMLSRKEINVALFFFLSRCPGIDSREIVAALQRAGGRQPGQETQPERQTRGHEALRRLLQVLLMHSS